MTQNNPIDHPAGSNENDVAFTIGYRVTDGDGDTIDGSIVINVDDDTPTVSANAAVQLDDDALAGGIAGGTGDVDPDTANLTGTLGHAFGADGAGSVTYLTSGAPAGFTYEASGDNLLIKQGGVTVITLTLNTATGAYTVTQNNPIDHPAGSNENDVAFTIGYRVTDGDGDTIDGSIVINVDDDTPVTYEPADATLTNAAGSPVVFDLDVMPPGDDNIANNFGADGPGVVRFPSTLHQSDSGETSGGVKIWYFLSNDGQTLTARTGADATAAASGTIIFTVAIDHTTSSYTVDMNGTVDNLGEVIFDEANFDFVGGNETWFGIVPNDQGPDDTPVDDESHDLLITPTNETTVNTSGILGGIDTGQSVGTGEGFRIDYVIDLTGEPAGGGADYQDGVDNGHFLNVEPGDVPSHYTTNGAFFTVRQSGGSDILLKAFDDTDNDNVVGDGTQDAITKIVIKYTNGAGTTFTSVDLIPTTTEQFVTLGGIQFSYELDDDLKSVHVGNVQGATGANENPNTTISTFTANGYNSLEVLWEGGETFKFAGFGIQDQLLEPVEISLPTEIVDADGDVVAGGDIDITLNPAPPVVLDMDGDSQVSFVDLSAGVAYDYNGDGVAEATAWVGSGDGILVRDANGDGTVDDASEFVFGGDGVTDMEALHAQYGDTARRQRRRLQPCSRSGTTPTPMALSTE